jgi:hypothetical protein
VAVAPSVLRAQEEAEANPQPDNAQLADPTPFGITAVLVLQNLGRTPEGRRLLQPSMPDLIAASIKNSAIAQYVEDLLDLLGDASRPAGENIS